MDLGSYLFAEASGTQFPRLAASGQARLQFIDRCLVRGFCGPIHYAIRENGDKNASTIRSKLSRITGFAI
jgi:hypothetical protein